MAPLEQMPGRSTGPRTTAGKLASSNNALKHGLTARKTVLPNEDQAEFDKLLASTVEDKKPEGEVERQLTTEIASCVWRLDRARRYENAALKHDSFEIFNRDSNAGRGFDRLQRYTGSIECQLNRAILRLQQLQAERRKQQQPASEPAPQPKALAASAGSEPLTTYPQFVSSAPEAAPLKLTANPDHYPLPTGLPHPRQGVTVRE